MHIIGHWLSPLALLTPWKSFLIKSLFAHFFNVFVTVEFKVACSSKSIYHQLHGYNLLVDGCDAKNVKAFAQYARGNSINPVILFLSINFTVLALKICISVRSMFCLANIDFTILQHV